jgi:1-acyl-sn-glycerol-3-phosphate acyltransferase
MVQLFYTLVLKASLLKITYIGLENLPDEPAIFAGNHQSSFDIPLMGKLTRGHSHVWLALASLMKSPILRFVLPYIAVLVDTSSAWKAVRSLLQVMDVVKKHKMDIMIFPEGGRYAADDDIHDFFGGFAILAKRTERPVVPVYIHGVNKVYPPKAFLVRNYPVTVVVGKPFKLSNGEDEAVFKKRVHDWFVKQAEGFKR